MSSTTHRTRRASALHPIAILLLPIPAIIAVLFADGITLSLLLLAVCLVLALAKGPRFAFGVLGAVTGGVALIWFGFSLAAPAAGDTSGPLFDWLPFSPSVERASFALRGALRIVAVVTLYVVTVASVRGRVLGDSIIQRFRAPYRAVDVLGLGGRFNVLIRDDIATARLLARLRSRGRPLRALHLLMGLTVPVLINAFNHADELSLAMDSRGFGSEPERTLHHALPLMPRDIITVLTVWVITILLAFAVP